MPLSAPLVGQRRKGEKQMFGENLNEVLNFFQVFRYTYYSIYNITLEFIFLRPCRLFSTHYSLYQLPEKWK